MFPSFMESLCCCDNCCRCARSPETDDCKKDIGDEDFRNGEGFEGGNDLEGERGCNGIFGDDECRCSDDGPAAP